MFYLLENGGKYIQYVKFGCELAGLPVGAPRQPLLALSEAEKADFRSLYEKLKSAKLGKLAA
jgi:4-hydroxy-tetrahydrodipicolinate synthase